QTGRAQRTGRAQTRELLPPAKLRLGGVDRGDPQPPGSRLGPGRRLAPAQLARGCAVPADPAARRGGRVLSPPPRPHPLARSRFAELAGRAVAWSWRFNEKPPLEPDYIWTRGSKGFEPEEDRKASRRESGQH